MAADKPTMVDLAREYEISLPEVFQHLKQLGFDKTKSTAQLTPKQAAAFHRRMKTEAARPRRPQIVAPAPRTASDLPPRLPERLETFHSTCTCCTLGFTYDAPRPESRLFCDHCVPHSAVPGEDVARQFARHQDHAERLAKALVHAREEAAHQASEASRAFRSRQGWLVALVGAAAVHVERDDHACTRGAGRYPCPTIKKIEEVRPKISQRIERLLSLPASELERILYPERPARDWAWEDEFDGILTADSPSEESHAEVGGPEGYEPSSDPGDRQT